MKFSFETNTIHEAFQTAWDDASFDDTQDGVFEKTSTSTTVLMKGGDKLSVDIDGEWAGIANFYLSVQGQDALHESSALLSDECFIELLEVYADGSDNGCEQDNTEPGDDGNCVCVSGYRFDMDMESDTWNECIKDNTMIYVGVGGAILVGLLLLGN